jgi:WXG100 family type VII secretion target
MATASSVEDAAQTLQAEFDRICVAVDEVVGSSWTGQAADGMRKEWTRWREGFADVTAGLRREGDALQTAATRYSSTDAEGETALARQMGL